jgi:cytochrome c oxidase subunit II
MLPEQASVYAVDTDRLYVALLLLSLFFTVLIFVLIAIFVVRYRHTAQVNRTLYYGKRGNLALEIGWILFPLILTMPIFYWGARQFFRIFQVPPGTLDVYVVGRQWMWHLQHEEGPREINMLHMPVGQTVRLHMISEDVIHSFFVPAFRKKMDVIPGRYTSTWFAPSKPGVYHLFCAEYCGTNHSKMIGSVVVQEPDIYAEWIASRRTEPPEVEGQRIAQRYGCLDCHGKVSDVRAPPWEGLFGRQVPLQDGTTVIADEHYIRESILNPTAKVTAGFQPIMPTFQGQISEDEIFQIIAYIRSLRDPDLDEVDAMNDDRNRDGPGA